jgi:hypothetical protein
MQFVQHPDTINFTLDRQYKGALFAMPLLLSPDLFTRVGWSIEKLDYHALANVFHESGVLSNQGQDTTFLARAVDASFVSSARREEQNVLQTLVSLHRSLPSIELAEELFRLNCFDFGGGGLVFLLGAVYRRASDPAPLYLPESAEFLTSRERLSMETSLSGAENLHYRHQLLPPVPLSHAIADGLRVGVRTWSALIEQPVSCDFGLLPSGDVTFEVKNEDSNLIYLRMAQDALSEQDRHQIFHSFVTGTSIAGAAQGHYTH